MFIIYTILVFNSMKKIQNLVANQQQEDPQIESDEQNEEQIEKDEVSQQNHQEINDEQQDIDSQHDSQPQQNIDQYKEKQSNKGVCYISRIPPYMKPNYIRKLLDSYLVERIYLLPESEWTRKNRIKRGGNKKICFRQGWVEFTDKRMAKLAALTLNGQKMVGKKGSFYSEDIWNLKYLPKFKWHNLTERLAHEERLKKQRLKVELQMEKKVDDFYTDKIAKSKQIEKIIQNKASKGKQIKAGNFSRNFQQLSKVEEINDE